MGTDNTDPELRVADWRAETRTEKRGYTAKVDWRTVSKLDTSRLAYTTNVVAMPTSGCQRHQLSDGS